MIVYQATKSEFADDVLNDRLQDRVLEYFKKSIKSNTSASEITSWRDSMGYMARVVDSPDIPDECGVAIEYQLPQSGKRLDFLLTGTGDD